MNWVLIAALLAAGVGLLTIGIYRGEWLLVIVGALVLVAGCVMASKARVDSKLRLTVVEVSPQGMTLRFSDSTTRTWSWKDPALNLQLVDYSAAVGGGPAGFRGFGAIPCAVIVGNGPVGISLEALKGIRRSARAAGVSVIDGVPDAISRNIHIGHAGVGPRPFSSEDPYD